MRIGAASMAATVGCAICVVGSAGAASAATGTNLETSLVLPYRDVSDVVVDTTTGYIFISGGSGSTYIDVLNLAGQAVGEIQNQDGAVGLLLSADGGTLYAADAATDSISVIDASTLTQTTSYATGAAPAYMTMSGGNLWFTTSSDADIHEVALSTGTVSDTGVSTGNDDSELISSSADPDVVLAGSANVDPPTIYDFNVSSGTPALTASEWLGTIVSGGCAYLDGWAITPDGKSLDLACGAPYYGLQLSLSSLGTIGQTYTTGPYPGSIDVSSDGETLVGVDSPSTVDVFDPSNSTAVASYALSVTGDSVAFVKWGANDSAFYAVMQGPSAYATFEAVHTGVSLTLSVPSATYFPNATFAVSGRLTSGGSAFAGAQVTLTRSTGGVTTTVGTVTTDSNGNFSYTASSGTALSTTTYTATVAGSTSTATASATITTIPVKYPITAHPVTTVKAPVATTVKTTVKATAKTRAKVVRTVLRVRSTLHR